MIELIVFTLAFLCLIFWLASFLFGLAVLVMALPGIALAAGLAYIGMPWWFYVPAGLMLLYVMAAWWEERRKLEPSDRDNLGGLALGLAGYLLGVGAAAGLHYAGMSGWVYVPVWFLAIGFVANWQETQENRRAQKKRR